MKKRRDLSIKEKVTILKSYDKLPKMGQLEAAAKLKISQPLLCKILKNRSSLEMNIKENQNLLCKRRRTGKDTEVESALKLWFTDVRKHDARVNGPLMRQKAEDLAKQMKKTNFVATDGWFQRWKKRENIVYKRLHGELNDADAPAAASWLEVEWPKIIADYSPDDVYNADETGLFYRALPEHTYLIKNETVRGCKVLKDRVTVLCCANMQGKKQRLLMIGKSHNPRCFKGIKKLLVEYKANANAWMTSVIFKEWLMKWDNQLTKNITLLVDNCTAHAVNVTLNHIKLIFLPANTTSLLQPLDQGIIRSLKAHYRREMRANVLEQIEDVKKVSANNLAKKTNLLEALHLLALSWKHVSEETIQNCFKKGGFGCTTTSTTIEDTFVKEPSDMTQTDFEEWIAVDNNLQVAAKLTEVDICEAVTQAVENKVGTDDEVEDDQPALHIPTNKEMREALRVLRVGVQNKSSEFELHYEYESFINNLLQKDMKQTKLDDFFK